MVHFLLPTASGSRSPNCSRTAISSISTCFQSGSAFNLLTDGSSSSGAVASEAGESTYSLSRGLVSSSSAIAAARRASTAALAAATSACI